MDAVDEEMLGYVPTEEEIALVEEWDKFPVPAKSEITKTMVYIKHAHDVLQKMTTDKMFPYLTGFQIGYTVDILEHAIGVLKPGKVGETDG